MGKKLWLFLVVSIFAYGMTFAQQTVTGTVIEQETGEPVIGASVLVEGTQLGRTTDVNGEFTIQNVPASAKTLRVSYVGLKTTTAEIKPKVKIYMESSTKETDQVIVVAFGKAKKSSYTGSATVVGEEELAKSQVSSITNALAGQVPGLQITSSNGAPGSTGTIRVRGFSSINAGKDPLIILDGAPYSGDLSNINPADVESMTVLKDATSTALYGARGANGVIMITTKSAKRDGNATITVDAKLGWNSRALQHYDVISSPREYYEMEYKALNNRYLLDGLDANAAWQKANGNMESALGYLIFSVPEGQMLVGQNGRMNPNATLGRMYNYNGQNYWVTPDDWEDEGTRTGLRQEYNVSVNGGSDRSTFFASLGYLNEEGITYKSGLERITGRLRADYQAKDWLKVGANFSFAHFDGNTLSNNGTASSTGNIWALTSQIAPIYPLYIRDGNKKIMRDVNGITMRDYGDGLNAGLVRPFITNANPLQDILLNKRNYNGNAATANGFVDINILEGLTLTLNGTYMLDETRINYMYNPYYGQFDSTGGTVEMAHSRTYDVNYQQILNYTTRLGNHHNLNVMVGHEYYDARYYELSGSKSKMFLPSNTELDGAILDGQSASSYKTRYNNEGFFGRALWDYDERIFANASLRRDASSRFAKDNRWGTFWSLGGAWLISKESWFDLKGVNELKLKASIGSQGNDNISSYLYTDLYDISNSDGEIGVAFSSKGNPDITWETNTNFNVGVEFGLWNKLSGSLEFYHRKTTDMLFPFSVAASLGYTSIYENVGDLYNSGFELTLNYNPIRNRNVDWNVNFNIATLRNRITNIHNDLETNSTYAGNGKLYKGLTSGSFFISEGLSMYTWRLKEYAGVDKETGEALYYKNVYKTDEDGNNVLTKNGDKIVDHRETTNKWSEADYYVTKKSTVPPVYGGFGSSIAAFGFDLSFQCSFQLGGKQYDSTYANFMSSPGEGDGENFHRDLLKSWSPENANSNIPRFVYGDLSYASTRFLTNASYLNIENINFGYTVPTALARRLEMQSLRVYLACENVGYFSARKGFDPRQGYSGAVNATTYSPMRTFSVGLTAKF